MTGWITVIGYQANISSAAFFSGTMIQGLLVLNYPDYVFERWHGTLLFYIVVIFSLFVNTYLARLLPGIESAVLVLHIIGFFCILIPLVYLAPHSSASYVFTTFANDGGWSSTTLSFFIGLSTGMYSFIGMILSLAQPTLRQLTCLIGIDAASHIGSSSLTSFSYGQSRMND